MTRMVGDGVGIGAGIGAGIGVGVGLLLAVAAGCSGAPAEVASSDVEARGSAESPAGQPQSPDRSPKATPVSPEERAIRAKVRSMLERVSLSRGLPIRREVPVRVLDRPSMLVRIRAQATKDLPPDVLASQGEALAALGLVPPDFDYVAGVFRLIEAQIAGFYVPEDGTMYLVDDLDDAEAEETLAHELVHALQDQSYDLAKLIAFSEGDSDRVTAAHALAEGDAMSAMLDVSVGSAFAVSESALRRLLAISTSMSAVGATTPRALTSSLTAPYADGFAFVQGLRRRGGWRAVDGAYRTLPVTTEQLLHLDKLDAAEPALPVAPPSVGELGEGYRAVWNDVMGEQGLRIVLEDWAYRTTAKEGAAGWGGDRLVVARRDMGGSPERRLFAAGWHMKFDTANDAAEVVEILKVRFGAGPCSERPEMGPFVWRARGRDVVIAAGPYERVKGVAKSAGGCGVTARWAEAMLRDGAAAPVDGAARTGQ